MKKGLTYISERTSQIRYSDNATNEQWVQQLSTYIPIQEIKRGQPVSIATADDLKRVAGEDDDLYEALLKSSDSYIVLTNPSRHEASVGLSLEYTTGEISLVDGELIGQDRIHVLGQGQYIEDKDYYANAFTLSDSVDVTDQEYWPAFFNDYENSIGKKVYVKGSTDGELTLVKEEAYLAHNNVIVIGFISDAKLSDTEGQLNVGAIEVQIEGDDRGILDATTFEAVVGEDVYIGKNRVQINGEENSATKVFALGAEDDSQFKFTFNLVQPENTVMPKGFIAIQRWDGKTAYIYTNGEISKDELLTNESYDYNDRAFWQVAQYFAVNCDEDGTKIESYDLECSKVGDLDTAKLEQYLKAAMVFVAPGEDVSLKDGRTTHITDLTITDKGNGRYECTANDVGGYFDVYISNNITAYFSDLNTASHGSYYNRGYAVLADIRNPKRQNIIGIYNSGHDGLVKKLENALFIKQGLFEDTTAPYEAGERYYLGSHGNIFKVPQEYYNSILSIGYAQDASHLLVDCCDSRQYNNGDLPVGYMKPSVKGNAEFGFWLMDGETPHKVEDAEEFFQRLQNWYDKSDLEIKTYNFGTADEPDYAQGFIIPKVEYQRHTDEDSVSYEPAQIKYLAEGVYKEMPRMPFVRRYVELSGDESHTTIPDIDITSLMIYGPEEDRIQVPDLESLDIKFFVNLSDDTQNNVRKWTQIEPGFHQSDNYTYFGFKWTVLQTEEPTTNHPYGVWVLRAAYTGTADADSPDDYPAALGVCYRVDPYAPPLALAGRKARVFVTRHDYYSRQFDVEALFKDYVKESVVDASDTPWKSNAVSGQAVRNDIWAKVRTKAVSLGDTDNYSSIEGYLSTLDIVGSTFEDEKELSARRVKSSFRLANSDNANGATPFIDYWNGLLKFYYENETDDNIETNKAKLKSTILNNGYALMPSFIFKEHKDTLIDDAIENDESLPHGISNNGWNGNLNAKTLQSANLGYPQHILSNNASEDENFSYSEKTNTAVRITIPYTQKNSDGKFITRLGDATKYLNATETLLDESLSKDSDEKEITKQINVPTGNNFVLDFFGNKDSNAKHIYAKFNFASGTPDISFVDSDDSALTLNGNFVNTSSIKTKYAYTLFETAATPETLPDGYESKFKSETSDLNEALQAIYEMPLATFKYNREDDNEYYKKYFGIIVERVAQTKTNIEENDISNKTTWDSVEYKYTDAEKSSMAEYLNMVTDNNEEGMRVTSAIGVLLKAAKETQERLLNLEVSTFGKDSPTLPGEDKTNDNFKANDQHATIAGLNRLVKALCREVFQDADPTSIDDVGAWSENSENYSRLDMLDKEVNGESAKDDDGSRITLAESTTYPDDASITETVEHTHQVIADKDNDSDFENATQYPQKLEYTYTKEDVDDFDGLNDAVNRIVSKLNQLTTDVVGEDDIKQRPKKLDYIRSSLETLIRELYGDKTEAEDIENGAYVKSTLSRIDRLLQSLYNFDLTYGTEKAKTTFNDKDLYGVKNDVDADDSTFASFSSRSPESAGDIFKNASILDVIIDLLATKEDDLVRTTAHTWKDSAKDANGWKINSNKEKESTYQVLANIENNRLNRHHEDILTRLDDIEKSLSMLYARATNNTDYRDDVDRVNKNADSSGSYAGVTSLDDFFYDISDNSGLTHDSKGIYSNNRTSVTTIDDSGNQIDDYSRTDVAKKVIAEDWKRPLHSTVSDFDAYDIIYDAITRIKNNEWNLAYNNTVLGVDYDDYADTQKSKTSYEDLTTDNPSYTKDYTITSDMKAILKLLYGADLANADDSSNKTTYSHFLTANERNDNFTKSPVTDGVSVLDELYNMLYNVPQAYNSSASKITSSSNYYSIINSSAYFDPAVLRNHKAADSSLLGNGYRTLFITQTKVGSTKAPKNRIDILEDWVKSIYNFIGFGSTSDTKYFTGDLGITFKDADNLISLKGNSTKGQQVYINSNSTNDVSNVYKNLNLTVDSTYKLSAIALQGYFNSLDIVSLLGSKTESGWKYNKPDTLSTDDTTPTVYSNIYGNEDSTPETVYTIKEAIDNLYSWTNKLDSAVMELQNCDNQDDSDIAAIYKALGDDYTSESESESISTRLGSLESTIDNATSTSATVTDYKDSDSVLETVELKTGMSGRLVKTDAVKEDLANVMSELQSEFIQAAADAQERAILIAYLKCNNITCDGTYVYVTRSGVTVQRAQYEAFTVNDSSSTNASYLKIDTAAIKRFGESYYKITIFDSEDQVEYSAYVPSGSAPKDYSKDSTDGTCYTGEYKHTTSEEVTVTIY